MANWFVSTTNGSNSNAGTSWNAAFATIGKALQTGSSVAAGDTIYVEPGVYREVITVAVQGSAGNPISIIGDVDGAGFRASGSSNPLTGEIRLTAWITNDQSVSSSSPTINLNGKSYLTFQNLMIVGGRGGTTATIEGSSVTGSVSIQFLDCVFFGDGNNGITAIRFTATAGSACDWLIDRCRVYCFSNDVFITIVIPTTSGGSDYDINFIVRNSLLIGGITSFCFNVFSSGANVNYGGGLKISFCTFMWSSTVVRIPSGNNISTTYPISVYNCYGFCSLSAQVNGQIIEDYNYFTYVSRANVTAGAHTQNPSTLWAACEIGQAEMWGRLPRPFMEPSAGSLLLGYGGSGISYDGLNRSRPAGGGQSLWGNVGVGSGLLLGVGYLERGNTASIESGIVQASSYSMRIDGPGYQDLRVAVDATSVQPSIYVYADSQYNTNNPIQASILQNQEIGVSKQTITAPSTTGVWNNISFSGFTPSKPGYFVLRLLANPSGATGKSYFDTYSM